MKLHIIARETIKPSSSTPTHLKTYKLCLLDQLTPRIYIPIVMFYINPGEDSEHNSTAKISHQLKNSLSKTLTQYYPFAGRLTDDGVTINCTDEGIDFLEAQINSQLSEILENPDAEAINLLFPAGLLWHSSDTSKSTTSLLGVQITFFTCGGMAISLCISHKIADGCTISTFLNDWASISRQSGQKVSPEFIPLSILSPPNQPIMVPAIELKENNICVTKRFVFTASKLAHLKARAAESGLVQSPTRVEVVTAILYKAVMAASKAKSGLSSLIQLVNMRPRMVPPLSGNSAGNFTWYFAVSNKGEIPMMCELVAQLREGKSQICQGNGKDLKVEEWILGVSESVGMVKVTFDGLEAYRCTSFCRYPLYEVEFGWGKPIWVRLASGVIKNTFVLIDTGDGEGIEAFVTMDEQVMAIFQHDEELLAFASSNIPIALA